MRKNTHPVDCFCAKHQAIAILAALIAILSAVVALPQAAQAQEQCSTLETNAQWQSGLKKITELIEANKFEEALALARELYPLCPQSPIINYFVAHCLKNTGDTVKATQFYQTASDNTFTIATPPQIAQKIWYARYEAEYPERSGENVKELKEKAETLEAQNRDMELKLASASALQSSDNSGNAIGMWTGVGIAAAGLALGGAFGYLSFKDNGDQSVHITPEGKAAFPTNAAVNWTIFGAGAALVVAGSVMTGIFGYRYTHAGKNEDIAFTISPTSASFLPGECKPF
ncbi:MAG: hypothetical protein II767_06585 [Proteobacteria bacterium]|nr:hypothetical protein [Pseudomonadota bacterium]